VQQWPEALTILQAAHFLSFALSVTLQVAQQGYGAAT
jgi:hypothetical protein